MTRYASWYCLPCSLLHSIAFFTLSCAHFSSLQRWPNDENFPPLTNRKHFASLANYLLHGVTADDVKRFWKDFDKRPEQDDLAALPRLDRQDMRLLEHRPTVAWFLYKCSKAVSVPTVFRVSNLRAPSSLLTCCASHSHSPFATFRLPIQWEHKHPVNMVSQSRTGVALAGLQALSLTVAFC